MQCNLQARVRVLSMSEGVLVVQVLDSNAVLRCKCSDFEPEQIKYKEKIFESLKHSQKKHKREQIVTLCVKCYKPPELTVQIVSVEESTQTTSTPAAISEGQPRKRQYLGNLS